MSSSISLITSESCLAKLNDGSLVFSSERTKMHMAYNPGRGRGLRCFLQKLLVGVHEVVKNPMKIHCFG